MRNLAVFVIVVAVLAVGGLWWLQGRPTPVSPGSAQSASAGTATSRDATTSAAPAPADDRPRVDVDPNEAASTSDVTENEVLVRVLDFQGRPAEGAAVIVRPYPDQQDAPRGRQVGTSDAAGTVHVRQLSKLLGDGTSTRLEFECAMPGLPTERQVVDSRSPPAELVFHMPASGSILVRLLEADGTPLDPRTLLRRQIALQHLSHDGRAKRTTDYQLTRSADVDGTATFEHVALGTEFSALNLSFGSTSFAGPTRAGERVEAILRREATGSYLTGRLLDADDAPLAATDLTISCSNDSAEYEGTTDADGGFRVWAGTQSQGAPTRLSVVTGRARSRKPGRPRAQLEARVLLPGDNDLGEVRLYPPEPVVAGTVFVDDRPDSSSVHFRVEHESGNQWRTDHGASSTGGADGTFAIFGDPGAGERLRLIITNGDLLPTEPIEFVDGSTDVEVRLHSGGSVTATFLVDESVPIHTFRYRLRERREPASRGEQISWEGQERMAAQRLEPAGEGRVRLRWPALSPGVRDLTVFAPDATEPLAQVEGLVIAEGPCEDARLEAIDLRGRLRTIRITARVPDGDLVRDAAAHALVFDEEGHARRFPFRDGAAEIAATAPVRVQVDLPGHRIAELEGVFEDREIQLERAPRFTFRMEPAPGDLPAGVHLELRLAPGDVDRSLRLDTGSTLPSQLAHQWTERHRLDAQGRATLFARRAGEYSITLAAAAVGALEEIEGVTPSTWTSSPEGEPGEIVLRVPQSAVTAAVERVK